MWSLANGALHWISCNARFLLISMFWIGALSIITFSMHLQILGNTFKLHLTDYIVSTFREFHFRVTQARFHVHSAPPNNIYQRACPRFLGFKPPSLLLIRPARTRYRATRATTRRSRTATQRSACGTVKLPKDCQCTEKWHRTLAEAGLWAWELDDWLAGRRRQHGANRQMRQPSPSDYGFVATTFLRLTLRRVIWVLATSASDFLSMRLGTKCKAPVVAL